MGGFRSVFGPRFRVVCAGLLLAFGVFVARLGDRWAIAASVLLRVEGAAGPTWLLHYRERETAARELVYRGGRGRLYVPRREPGAPGVVLAHGMHEEGIDEPRMIAFARALAGAGFVVLTPRLDELAQFRLGRADLERIAAASDALARELGQPRVTVLGVSFGGGLAIRAACEGRGAIERVIALGAHHDAERVTRFYLGEPARDPGGEPARVTPHPYGRVALWRTLFDARHGSELSDDERARARSRLHAMRPALRAVSPRYCPGPLRVPLFLVHGSGDRVVPAGESLWNARQFAAQGPVRTLVSSAISHAEYAQPGWRERLALIGFMVSALDLPW